SDNLMKKARSEPGFSSVWLGSRVRLGWRLITVAFRLLDPEPGVIKRWQEEERDCRTRNDAAHHGIGHRSPEHFARDGDQRKTCRCRRERDGAHSVLAGLRHCIPWMHTLGNMLLNLHNQDDRVADENAYQRQHAEDRHETERLAAWQQSRHDADQSQRRHGHYKEKALEALELKHQDGRHDEQHQWNDRSDRTLALATFLHRTRRLDIISRRKLVGEGLDGRCQILDDRVWHRLVDDAGGNRDRWNARTTVDNRLLQFIAEIGNRRQWYRCPVAGCDLETLQRIDGVPFLLLRPRDHVDQIDRIPHLRNRDPANDTVEGRCNILRGNAELSRLVLHHIDANDTARLVPIIIDDTKPLVRAEDTGKILRDTSQFLDVWPRNAIRSEEHTSE